MKDVKKANLAIFVIILFLVAFAVFLWFYQRERYSDIYFNYNGFDVHRVNFLEKGFVYKISLISEIDKNLYSIESRFNPMDLEEIPVNANLDDIYDKEALFITMDNNATGVSVLAATEISKVTGNDLIFRNPKVTHGALNAPIQDKNVTVVTCDNVNEYIGVISFEIGDKPRIYSENGCVIVVGKDENDLIRVADRLMLTLLGIMKP
ncbi:MAG: hypothetical protein AABW46_00495 [Nanoarchaeota archaeon]